MRSVPIKLDKKIPRRAAILGKRVSEDRGTSHAYLVYKQPASVDAALAHNMKEVILSSFVCARMPPLIMSPRKSHKPQYPLGPGRLQRKASTSDH